MQNSEKVKKLLTGLINKCKPERIEIPAKTTLLREGDIANKIFIVEKGCLRQTFNKDGKDITFQFFFENQPVSSFDSFISGVPSIFAIQSIEQSKVLYIKKQDFVALINTNPKIKDEMQYFVYERFRHYTQLFLSRIKDSPEERYTELLQKYPQIIQRVPQHYIASYLGITAVSLSRIRNRR